MNNAKIQLSPYELELVTNADVILTKNSIIAKVYELFGHLAAKMKRQIHGNPAGFDKEVSDISPKISKGENYMGLPYVMLDYPRYFEKENILAVRTMFWWGNFFSVGLHLKGKYKLHCEEAIKNGYSLLKQNNCHISISADEWQHHFGPDNYVSVHSLESEQFNDVITAKDFIKIASMLPVAQWGNAEKFILDNFTRFVKFPKRQFPKR
ncbi:MAG: hypothetical protein SFU87_12805 [Chitinophagaceae bacterium]|nr:hypothetical protein [Chitinophagaceae bacterium]